MFLAFAFLMGTALDRTKVFGQSSFLHIIFCRQTTAQRASVAVPPSTRILGWDLNREIVFFYLHKLDPHEHPLEIYRIWSCRKKKQFSFSVHFRPHHLWAALVICSFPSSWSLELLYTIVVALICMCLPQPWHMLPAGAFGRFSVSRSNSLLLPFGVAS